MEPFIAVQRFPYEEPYHAHIHIDASNGQFGGAVDFYCNVEDLANIGRGLQNFPCKVPDEYRYENGSKDPAARVYSYLLIRAYTIDRVGHCALQISMSRNAIPPVEGMCEFSITAEPSAINRLGMLFERFAKLEHLELRWGLAAAELDGVSVLRN